MSRKQETTVAIVGAGTGGTSLLQTLISVEGIRVVGIADPRPDAPGAALARQRHIRVYRDFEEMLRQPVDVIIEATGREEVARGVHQAKPPGASVADSAVARIMWALVDKHLKLEERVQGEIRTRAQEMTAAAAQLLSTIEELSSSSDVVAKGAARVADEATRAAEALGRAGEVLEATGQALQFVKRVANETNLLGLNAAIEAAHAGEHGRGFSVVAQEVRKLARDSSQSADQIGQIIKNVNHFLQETVQAVNSVATIAQEQAASAMQAASAVGGISTVATAVAGTSRELASLSGHAQPSTA